MRILVVGGGGREHTLVWQLTKSPEVEQIFCAPGNGGIASLAECVPISVNDIEALLEFALKQQVDLTLVGPEAPLVDGIGDRFREENLLIFGPGSSGARLEGSKIWAKRFMERFNIPTAAFKVFNDPNAAMHYLDEVDYPVVVKADGLAAGKGVVVAPDRIVAQKAVQDIMVERVFGSAGDSIVVEDCLKGEEISLFAVMDGHNYVMFPSAQDHKAAYEGDRGPNTGGMGAYSPSGIFTPELVEEAAQKIFTPVLQGLKQEGIEYRGVLFVGCMLTPAGLSVLEFNVRFGDPETQVILPRLSSPLLPVLLHTVHGELKTLEAPRWSPEAAVCVVMAAGGYPGSYETGKVIYGLDDVQAEKAVVFHAGTSQKENRTVTSGGRVLGITAWDADLNTAQKRAYNLVEKIQFEGAYYRSDIAHRAFSR